MHAYKKDRYSNPSHDNRETILADLFQPPAQTPTGTLTVVKYREAALEPLKARQVRQNLGPDVHQPLYIVEHCPYSEASSHDQETR